MRIRREVNYSSDDDVMICPCPPAFSEVIPTFHQILPHISFSVVIYTKCSLPEFLRQERRVDPHLSLPKLGWPMKQRLNAFTDQ